ncbi:MAG: hypothetical protein DRP08_04470 [Candidatus Aenigmatarchaeota archaeon]|nr:MAG: hypothetical protein DRP08_04470 [Candidatus Aenigmarchaeota archaeon]
MQVFPKIYIIILNYNNWQDTIDCLESVLRNDYPNYQVIVVDNGSQDNSMEYIKTWAEGRQEVLTPESSHPLYYLFKKKRKFTNQALLICQLKLI